MATRKTKFQWQADEANKSQEQEKPSRSAKKRQALALQNMGEEMSKLGLAELMSFDLPGQLQTAFTELATLKSHEARRRQKQYIGRLMRELTEEEVKKMEFAMANRS